MMYKVILGVNLNTGATSEQVNVCNVVRWLCKQVVAERNVMMYLSSDPWGRRNG